MTVDILPFVAFALFVAGGITYCWKYPSFDASAVLPPPPPPPPPGRFAVFMSAFWDWVEYGFKVAGLCLAGLVGLAFVAWGIVSLFSLDDSQFMNILIVMACMTVISGGFKK